MRTKPTPIIPDAQVDALISEAANPSLSRDRVYFGDPEAEANVAKLRASIAAREAKIKRLVDRDNLDDGDAIGDLEAEVERLEKQLAQGEDSFRIYQVRIPNLNASRRLAKVLAPKLVLLKDLAARAADAAEGGQDTMALGLEALADMGPVVEQLADEVPEILEALFATQGATKEWLDQNVLLPQVVEALTKQFAKLGSVDLLGKLLRSGGPSQ